MTKRARMRRNWRKSWKGYVTYSATRSNRPISKRFVRRNYWREEWLLREQDEYLVPEVTA